MRRLKSNVSEESYKKQASMMLYKASKKTWRNRKGLIGEVIVLDDSFSGRRGIDISKLPKGTILGTNCDGIGTKVEIAEKLGDYTTIAHNLIAMVCDDAIVQGAEPILITSNLDVNSIGGKDYDHLWVIKQIAEGYFDAAYKAGVAVINGEIAELGDRVRGFGNFNFTWNAAVTWIARKDRMFTGREIKPGDYIVALREEGFRSNGYTLFRKIMEDVYGPDWHTNPRGKEIARDALAPSRIYSKAAVEMFGGYNSEPKTEVHGFAHITGEGIPEKLGRILQPSGLGAKLDNLFPPSELMLVCQAKANLSDETAYKTWNMGQGMFVITPKPGEVMTIALRKGIDSQLAGIIVEDDNITIKSKGHYNNGEYLNFPLLKD